MIIENMREIKQVITSWSDEVHGQPAAEKLLSAKHDEVTKGHLGFNRQIMTPWGQGSSVAEISVELCPTYIQILQTIIKEKYFSKTSDRKVTLPPMSV